MACVGTASFQSESAVSSCVGGASFVPPSTDCVSTLQTSHFQVLYIIIVLSEMSGIKSTTQVKTDEGLNVLREEVVDLQSRFSKREHQVDLRLGNIENVVSQIQQSLTRSSNLSSVSVMVEEKESDVGFSDSSRRASGSDLSAECIAINGMDLKISDSQADLERKFHHFLSETLGFSPDQMHDFTLADKLSMNGGHEMRDPPKLLVCLQRKRDVDLIRSRATEARDFEIFDASKNCKKEKKLKKSLPGYAVLLVVSAFVFMLLLLSFKRTYAAFIKCYCAIVWWQVFSAAALKLSMQNSNLFGKQNFCFNLFFKSQV